MNDKIYEKYSDAALVARDIAASTATTVGIVRCDRGFSLYDPQKIQRSEALAHPPAQWCPTLLENYELDESHWAAAIERANEMPIYERSHRERDANIVGALGEIVAEMWFRENQLEVLDEREKTTHDYRFASGIVVDVKTKDRTVAPRADFDCSVPLYNHEHQQPDYYLFVSLRRPKKKRSVASSFSHAYLLGLTDQATLNDVGVLWQANQTDKRNNTTFWTDCLNIEVQQLIAPEDAIELLRQE